MDPYLLLAPVLLLPVLQLLRLVGCSLDFEALTRGNGVGVCSRGELEACAADEHVVEFVVVFDRAGRNKEDLEAEFVLTPTVADRAFGRRVLTPAAECPGDIGFPDRDPGARERFAFFACVPQLAEGQYQGRCRVQDRGGGPVLIEGDCTGEAPTGPGLRVQFVGSAGDLRLRSTHCFTPA